MEKIIVNIAKNDNDFVGIICKTDEITINFPVGYCIEERVIQDPNSENLNTLYKDFRIFTSILEKTDGEHYNKGEIKFSFSNAQYIIEDYLKNGLYKSSFFYQKLNGNGKVNWKKTINKTEPIIWKNSMIFKDRYTIQVQNSEDIITKIQKKCIYTILKVLGWKYITLRATDFYVDMDMDNSEMIYKLENELQKTNQDCKKELLSKLILFISGTNIVQVSEYKELKIGRKHFDKEWEKLLRKQLYMLYPCFDRCNPNTYYVFENGDKINNSSLIPDMIFKVGNTIVIVDAKYYGIGSFPKSSDVSKQLFYGDYLRVRNQKCTIYNCFILPKNIPIEKYEKIGYALADGWDMKKKIDLFYIDTKSLMTSCSALEALIEEFYLPS